MDASLQSRANQLAEEFAKDVKTAEGFSGLMRLMTKTVLEKMLNTEMDVQLGRRGLSPKALTEVSEAPAKKGSPNRRNGNSKKTVQGDKGEADDRRASRPRRNLRADHRPEASAKATWLR